jgi:hypothetical protein
VQRIGPPGFLQDADYTTRKDGLGAAVRQPILTEVFLGKQDILEWLSDTITLQGGASQTVERFNKIRSTINVGLGAQKRADQTLRYKRFKGGKLTLCLWMKI